MRVELLFAWIQQLVSENIRTGVLNIPPPILSRAFQELANGMVAFHNAKKICEVPFPFPYAQVCDLILIAHWVLTPVVTSVWSTNLVWSAVLCFIQIFVLWSLNLTAIEIDNPFGKDPNDLPGQAMQREFNLQLRFGISPKVKRTPRLAATFRVSAERVSLHIDKRKATLSNFKELLEVDQEVRWGNSMPWSAFSDGESTSSFSHMFSGASSLPSPPRRNSITSDKGSLAVQMMKVAEAPQLDDPSPDDEVPEDLEPGDRKGTGSTEASSNEFRATDGWVRLDRSESDIESCRQDEWDPAAASFPKATDATLSFSGSTAADSTCCSSRRSTITSSAPANIFARSSHVIGKQSFAARASEAGAELIESQINGNPDCESSCRPEARTLPMPPHIDSCCQGEPDVMRAPGRKGSSSRRNRSKAAKRRVNS
jgi:hypothetical protein